MVPDKCDDEVNYRLASIVESSDDAIIGKTLDGVITSWNKGAEEVYGYRADEVIGKPINILVPPGYPDDIPQIMEKIRRGGRVVRYETVRVRKDGKEIYVSLTVSPIKDEKGRIIGASTIARDISLRKSYEAVLRSSEEKYRRIVDLSEEGIFVLDENDTVTFANKKLAVLLGYSIGEIVGKNITAFMDEEDKGCIEWVKSKHLEGHVIQFDFRFRRKDGSYIWTIVPTSPIFDEEHHYAGALYMISDITEHKRIEEALRLNEARYRAIVESQIELICRYGPDFTLTFANDAFCKYFGVKCSEITKYNFLDFIPKEDHNKFIDRVALLNSLKPSITIDSHVTVPGGESRWHQWVHVAIFDNLGRFIELQSVGRDITERKRAEEDRKRLLHDLGERVKELTALHRVYYIIQKGRSVPEVLQEITDILPPAWQYPEVTAARIIFDGREYKTPNFLETPWKQRADFHTAIGKHGAIEVYYLEKRRDEVEGPFLAEERNLINSLTETVRIYLDKWYAEKALTDAKAQAELYLDLMGHDIRNMNQVGMGFLELVLDSPSIGKKDKELLLKSIGALESSTRLIENVGKVQKAQSGELKHSEVDACQAILRVLAHYSNMPRVKATFNYELPPGCPVIANELLYEVFENIVGNAIKHTGPEPIIGIKFETASLDGKNYNKFIIEDTGPGIPDDMKDRLFNRLHRGDTKAKGSGLGLYLVKSLVDGYGGRVWIEDRVQGDHTKGARFVVMLPAVEK